MLVEQDQPLGEDPTPGASAADGPRVMVVYRTRGMPWLVLPPLLILSAVASIVVYRRSERPSEPRPLVSAPSEIPTRSPESKPGGPAAGEQAKPEVADIRPAQQLPPGTITAATTPLPSPAEAGPTLSFDPVGRIEPPSEPPPATIEPARTPPPGLDPDTARTALDAHPSPPTDAPPVAAKPPASELPVSPTPAPAKPPAATVPAPTAELPVLEAPAPASVAKPPAMEGPAPAAAEKPATPSGPSQPPPGLAAPSLDPLPREKPRTEDVLADINREAESQAARLREAQDVKTETLKVDPRERQARREEIAAMTRRNEAERRVPFHADLRQVLVAKGIRGGRDIQDLREQYGWECPPEILNPANRDLVGPAANLGTQARVQRMRRWGMPETRILDDLFEKELVRMNTAGGPRSIDEVWVFAARRLLSMPPPPAPGRPADQTGVRMPDAAPAGR